MGHMPPPYSPCYETIIGQRGIFGVDDLAEALDELDMNPTAAAAAKCQMERYVWVHVSCGVQFQSNTGLLDCGGVSDIVVVE